MAERYSENLDDWFSSDNAEPENQKNIQSGLEKPDTINETGPTDKTDIARILYFEAERLESEKRYSEALTLINVTIENDPENYHYTLKKALILEKLNKYSEAYDVYEKLQETQSNDEIDENFSRLAYKWANSLNDKQKALELINEAIVSLPESSKDEYFEKFWYMKGSILDCLGQPLESRKCYLIAEGLTEEVKKLDAEINMLKSSKDTLITVSGTRFYFGLDVFKPGQVLDLIKETDNEHDSDAIRVEIEGETVGYVANSEFTLIEGVKSASEIRSLNFKRAEVVFIYMDEYVIAKLIE